MFTEDSSFMPRPRHGAVSWLIHGRLAFLVQVPPGPRPLCSRNGARTWAGRPSEPQLGSGKTSGRRSRQTAVHLPPVATTRPHSS